MDHRVPALQAADEFAEQTKVVVPVRSPEVGGLFDQDSVPGLHRLDDDHRRRLGCDEWGRVMRGLGRPIIEQERVISVRVNITAKELAEFSRVGLATIRRVEGLSGPLNLTAANSETLVRTLESRGVEFIAENGGGPGVRLRKPSA